MGQASAKAQKLPQVITTSGKLFSSDNRLYIRAEGRQVIGILKVGRRNLFIRNDFGQIKEIKPLCVLDFYVHESIQRGGHGRALFEKMLQTENVRPEKLGYDRPSEKLIGFCGKHFGLKKYVPQNNNFVVFDAYWAASGAPGASSSAYDRFQNHQSMGGALPPRPDKNVRASASNFGIGGGGTPIGDLGRRKLSDAGMQVMDNASQ